MKENKNKISKCENADDDENIIGELKRAYRAINALKKTPSHRKIALDVERKLRSQNEKTRNAQI